MIFADIFVRFRTKSFVTNRALEETVRSQVLDSLFQVHHTTLHCVKQQICKKVNDDSQDNR